MIEYERNSRFCKGAWVRYSGPQEPFNDMLGQVTGHDNARGIIYVRFLSGGNYGCYVQFLTKVYKRTAALEIAKIAIGVGQ